MGKLSRKHRKNRGERYERRQAARMAHHRVNQMQARSRSKAVMAFWTRLAGTRYFGALVSLDKP
jgi:hypothetical protein